MKISVYDNQLTQSRYYTKYRGHTIIIGRLGIFWAIITNFLLAMIIWKTVLHTLCCLYSKWMFKKYSNWTGKIIMIAYIL
jgi:hypothetical protein